MQSKAGMQACTASRAGMQMCMASKLTPAAVTSKTLFERHKCTITSRSICSFCRSLLGSRISSFDDSLCSHCMSSPITSALSHLHAYTHACIMRMHIHGRRACACARARAYVTMAMHARRVYPSRRPQSRPVALHQKRAGTLLRPRDLSEWCRDGGSESIRVGG